MSQTIDIMKRIQKYDGINLFLVLDKNGKKLNPELDEEEKKNIPNAFNTTYTEIPNLVSAIPKASSIGVTKPTIAAQNFREVNFCFQLILIGILPFFK